MGELMNKEHPTLTALPFRRPVEHSQTPKTLKSKKQKQPSKPEFVIRDEPLAEV